MKQKRDEEIATLIATLLKKKCPNENITTEGTEEGALFKVGRLFLLEIQHDQKSRRLYCDE